MAQLASSRSARQAISDLFLGQAWVVTLFQAAPLEMEAEQSGFLLSTFASRPGEPRSTGPRSCLRPRFPATAACALDLLDLGLAAAVVSGLTFEDCLLQAPGDFSGLVFWAQEESSAL